MKDVSNSFLNHKSDLLEAGELSPLTWRDYKAAADLIIEHFGKRRLVADLGPDDFAELRNKMARTWGAVRVRDFVQRIRSIFKHAWEVGLIETPMRFGPGFRRPTKKTLRLERASKGPRMFEADELRKIIGAAGQPLKAMILLGINAGFGNADCATLPLSALDLGKGWIDYPRPKTGIGRRCPLWPETIEAIKQWLEKRPTRHNGESTELVFITRWGNSWHNLDDRPISKEMRKLLNSLNIDGHRNLYALRHTVETIGGEAKDQVTVDYIMGHARDDMASVYRERISDERLHAVVNHVREWLYPEQAKRN